MALNSDNQVYGWGRNDLGQCGRKSINNDNEYLLPKLIDFNSESVIQISCGSNHSLALTSSSLVYCWGGNKYGQVGCGKDKGEFISEPYKLSFFDDLAVKNIYAFYDHSFALTCDGYVYSWGCNVFSQLGHQFEIKDCVFEPNLIHISNVISVCFSTHNTYLLTNEGYIYFCGRYICEQGVLYQKTPKPIECDMKFSSINSIPLYQQNGGIASAVHEDNIYYLYLNFLYKLPYSKLFMFYLGD